MPSTELQRLMHAVLDGEASPEEAHALERELAASPAMRAEFEQLKDLFDELAAVPPRHPPEGLVAAVTAALPVIPDSRDAAGQLPAASRVLGASEGIHLRGKGPVEQQHQPHPSNRRPPMTQPHPPYSAKRKAWIGAGIALVAVAIVVRYGFDTVPKSEDVAGTVVPAQRYRAPQAADIQLGDQTLAQLMQNDGFVRLIRDPQVQALVREPGFAEAAMLLREHPEAARLMLVHAESGKQVLAAPELVSAMEANATAAYAVERTAAAAVALRASPEAQALLRNNRELERYVAFFATLERKAGEGQKDFLNRSAGESMNVAALDKQAQQAAAADMKAQHAVAADRIYAQNLEQAQLVAERAIAADKKIDWLAAEKAAQGHASLERLIAAHHDLARVAPNYVSVAKQLQASAAAQARTLDARAVQLMMSNREVAQLLARSPSAMRAVFAHPEAARVMLATPEAGSLLRSPAEANRVMESITAERAAERVQK